MKKRKRKSCELREFGKDRSHVKHPATLRRNTHEKRNMAIVVEGRQGDVLYTNFLHPIYGSNDELRANQATKKMKKKQTILKRIKNIFSKNNSLKNENKNSKQQLLLKKYNDSFVLPHLQNTYTTQNFTTPKIANASKSDGVSKNAEKINSIKNSKCEIYSEKGGKPTEEIKDISSKSEIGIQTVWNGNEAENRIESLLQDSNIPGLIDKQQDSIEELYKEQIIGNCTASVKTNKKSQDRKFSSNNPNNQLLNLSEDKTNVTSNDSIYTIPLTNLKLAMFEKTHSFESENKSCGRTGTTEPSDGAENHRRIHSLCEYDEINSQRGWSLNYELNYLSSGSDDTLQKRKNTQHSFPETEEFEKLRQDYDNNMSKNYDNNSEKNVLKSHNNYCETEEFFSSFNQASKKSFNQKISKKESSPSDRPTHDYASEKKLNCENNTMFSNSKNDLKKEETTMKIPLFSQPEELSPLRQCCGPPRFIWSRAASPFNMEIEKMPNIRLQQINENVRALSQDSSNKLNSSFRKTNETKSRETHTNILPDWEEEEDDSKREKLAKEKKITVIEANSSNKESSSGLNVFKNTELKNNFTDQKTFPTLSNDLNIFEKCRKRENEHSGLNISLQQFKDLKNNLCITLCSSTLYDDEQKIFKNAYNNLQFDENNLKLPNLANSENSKRLNLLQTFKEPSERSMTTAKSTIGSTSTLNNSYAASQKYKELNKENLCLKGEQVNIKQPNLSQTKQNVKRSTSKHRMAANNYKRSTHINKLLDPGVKKTVPLNGFIRLNKNEILNKSNKDNELNESSKKKIPENGKTSLRNMPHGAFSGNISGSSNKGSIKSAKKTNKNK